MRQITLLLLGLLGQGLAPVALAQAGDLTPAVREVQPGGYATLVFAMQLDGDTRLEPLVPEGWTLVTLPRTVPAGQTLFPVTVRVPPGAAGGQRFPVRLRLSGAAGVRELTLEAQVKPRRKLEAQGPRIVPGSGTTPVGFTIEVHNLGNVPDRVRFGARGTTWPVVFEPAELSLGPGERASVRVTVLPTSVAISKSALTLWLDSRSTLEPEVSRTLKVVLDLSDPNERAGADRGPQLRFSVKLGAELGLTLRGEQAEWTWGYSVAPGLSGQLSDRVSGALEGGTLEGKPGTPFGTFPGTRLSLQAERWNAALGLGPGTYDLSGQWKTLDWTLSGGAALGLSSAQARYGLTLGAERLSLDSGLSLSAQTSGAVALVGGAGVRNDALRGRYRFGFLGGQAEVGAALAGTQAEGYQLGLATAQSFRWQNDLLDLNQGYTYSGQTHSLSLMGGSRAVQPFGVRASSVLTLNPGRLGWRTALGLLATPLPGLSLGLGGTLGLNSGGPDDALDWSLSPSIGGQWSGPDWHLGLTASYQHQHSPQEVRDALKVGLNGGAGALKLQGDLLVQQREDGEGRDHKLEGNLSALYALSSQSVVSLKYGLSSEDALTRHSLGGTWKQFWTPHLSTEVTLERRFGQVQQDQLGVQLNLARLGQGLPLLGPGLDVGLGYTRMGSDLFSSTVAQKFSLKLGLSLSVGLATPEAVVQAFGGQRSGEVRGLAFLDRDGDGKPSPGEPPLAGLELRVGTRSVTTDASGLYRLSLPMGRHTLTPVSGFAANLTLTSSAELTLSEGERLERLLAFEERVAVPLSLFDDTNRNGLRDPQEQGIAYGGVRIEGPVSLKLQADSAGTFAGTLLPPGQYSFAPDPASLPADYQATSAPVTRSLVLGQPSDPVVLGAALPQKTIQATYTLGQLSLFAQLPRSSAVAGSDLRIEAFAQGASEVSAELAGQRVVLQPEGGRFVGWLRLPRDLEGWVSGVVRAVAGERRTEQPITLELVPGPLFEADALEGRVGQALEFSVQTLFRSPSLDLVLPGGERLPLESTDQGFTWRGVWLPVAALVGVAEVRADGQVLGGVGVQAR